MFHLKKEKRKKEERRQKARKAPMLMFIYYEGDPCLVTSRSLLVLYANSSDNRKIFKIKNE